MITVPILKTPKLAPVFPITVHRHWTKLSYFSANTRPLLLKVMYAITTRSLLVIHPTSFQTVVGITCRICLVVYCIFLKNKITPMVPISHKISYQPHYIYLGFSKTGLQLHLGLTYRLNRVGRTCWKSLANYLFRLCSSDPVR